MNSLQLVSKIKSKTDDFSKNIHTLISASEGLSSLDKDVLKKQCLDLYELLLKLKSEAELLEEKPISKPISIFEPISTKQEPPIIESKPIVPEPKETIIPEPETLRETPVYEAPIIQAQNFQEVVNFASESEESLDDLLNKVELIEQKTTTEVPPIEKSTEVIEPIKTILSEPKIEEETKHINEPKFGKATENKRIQYTVMPDISVPKPINSQFTEREPTYNEKLAQLNTNEHIPLANKTLEAPIDSIKSAINLNKKISFVNFLFNENVVEYAKAIERLNNAQDLNDAFRIQNEMKHLYAWDNENELVQDLERLIRRRFS